MIKYLFFILFLTVSVSSQAQFGKLLEKAKETRDKITPKSALSQEEIGKGLKEALDEGVSKAVGFLSEKDGYYKSPYKILIPEDAQKVTNKLKKVPGWSNVENDLEEKMNRAAELAAQKAKPIFIKAIKNMSFRDAMDILMGKDDAATNYLSSHTRASLVAEFLPIIKQALDEVNATTYWHSAVTAYNKIPFTAKANPDLDKYVTQTALDGMFQLIAKKELDIRKNTSSRSTDLLKKVFSQQD
ncbi:MAG TPA: DUF4197 domain-containing protein [Saprospiraceae bacterium]|nr:DUF4197 domain-containing protein [Saprospiraceae bacterium]